VVLKLLSLPDVLPFWPDLLPLPRLVFFFFPLRRSFAPTPTLR